jgi:hypothetical protein
MSTGEGIFADLKKKRTSPLSLTAQLGVAGLEDPHRGLARRRVGSLRMEA